MGKTVTLHLPDNYDDCITVTAIGIQDIGLNRTATNISTWACDLRKGNTFILPSTGISIPIAKESADNDESNSIQPAAAPGD